MPSKAPVKPLSERTLDAESVLANGLRMAMRRVRRASWRRQSVALRNPNTGLIVRTNYQDVANAQLPQSSKCYKDFCSCGSRRAISW